MSSTSHLNNPWALYFYLKGQYFWITHGNKLKTNIQRVSSIQTKTNTKQRGGYAVMRASGETDAFWNMRRNIRGNKSGLMAEAKTTVQ